MNQYIVTRYDSWNELMVLKKFDQEDEDNYRNASRYAKTVDYIKNPQVWERKSIEFGGKREDG